MNSTSIETYIAKENPKAVAKLLTDMGAPAITSNEDLLSKIHYATDKYGRKVFEKLAKIETPMRSLILTFNESESKSNCGGCSHFSNCSGYGNVAGDNPDNMPIDTEIKTVKSSVTYAPSSTHNGHPLLIAGVVLLGVITMSLLVKK